jgi:hypothetical protein
MGASCTRGNSNNSAYGIPIGGGTAKQGLVSTKNMAINGAMVNHIRTRAGGENRDLVFCVNQLGGVGKNRSQFGPTADGLGRIGCPTRPRSDGLTLTAADLLGGSPPVPGLVIGFSDGSLGGPDGGGSLVPSSISGTEIMAVYSNDYPGPMPPPQLHLRMREGSRVPVSITFTGGDLPHPFLSILHAADIQPPTTIEWWAWMNHGFHLTAGVTYTIFLDY